MNVAQRNLRITRRFNDASDIRAALLPINVQLKFQSVVSNLLSGRNSKSKGSPESSFLTEHGAPNINQSESHFVLFSSSDTEQAQNETQ